MMGFYSLATVKRPGRTISGTQQTAVSPVTVFGSLNCRLSPLPTRLREGILGDFSTEQLLVEYGEEEVLNGDLFEIDGKTYQFKPLQRDLFRPSFSTVPKYQTGILTEQKKPRQ
jgi:hypothetical protein